MNINSDGLARGHIVIIMRFVRKGGCWSAVGLRDEAHRERKTPLPRDTITKVCCKGIRLEGIDNKSNGTTRLWPFDNFLRFLFTREILCSLR